jgi:hypothetical protein
MVISDRLPILSLVLSALWSGVLPTEAQVNVTQHHNHDSRDGLYIDAAFTQSAAGNLTRDLGFKGNFDTHAWCDSNGDTYCYTEAHANSDSDSSTYRHGDADSYFNPARWWPWLAN